MARSLIFTVLLLLLGSRSAEAHVGSPNVFYQGSAGPYEVRVSIQPPEVIPGRAQINVRVVNGSVTNVTALPVRWDAGRKGAPPPDVARPVRGETNLFSTELWLMAFGAYSVFVDVHGARGSGTAIVPLNSVAQQRLPMPRAFAIGFLVAGFILAVLLVFIIGSAVRESVLPPGVASDGVRTRRARFSMAAAGILLCLLLGKGNAWWKQVDAEFRNNRLFKPVEVSAKIVTNGERALLNLESRAPEQDWRDRTPLVADHGKLMHLFLIRQMDMGGFAHLHPVRTGAGVSFESQVPPLPPGLYSVYGEVTHESGLARTLVSSIDVPDLPKTDLVDPDDSWWASGTAPTAISIRQLDPCALVARQEMTLRFDVLGSDGKPAPLEPYMGMWSHAVVRAADGSVFTHLHPSGTISMTAQELFARRERGEDLRKPIDVVCGRPERELSFPYMFPKSGTYRMWVQVKSSGQIVTAPFDFEVLPPGG
jgi:hypothetical protein